MASGVPGCPDLSFRDLDLAFKCHEHSPRERGTIIVGSPGAAFVGEFRADDVPTTAVETVLVCGATFSLGDDWIVCRAWRFPNGKSWSATPPARSNR